LVFGLRAGLPYALLSTLLDARHDWRAGLINGVFFGVVFGAIMARLAGRARAALGSASPEQVRHAARALRRGSVPADPQLRDTAYRLALYRLQLARRLRIPASVLFGMALALGLAVAMSRGFGGLLWVGSTFFAGMIALAQWQPISLRRRTELLRPNPDALPR
jgi:hypothetical protein